MASFIEAVTKTLLAEGGFVHNSVTGEIVNYGITSAFLGSIGQPNSESDVQNLTRDQAINLYHEYFWEPLNAGAIVDQNLANKVFDIAVNQGLRTSAKMLQEAVNGLQLGAGEIQEDGIIGRQTIAAINALPPSNLLIQFKALAEVRYREIAEENPKLAGDLAGWLQRLAS
jgi:lysozyme family protein